MATSTGPPAPNAAWVLGDPKTNENGSQSAPLLVCNEQLRFQLGRQGGEELTCPWQAEHLDETALTAKLVDWRVPPALAKQFREVDSWTVQYVAANSRRLLGRQATPAEVHAWYKPLVQTRYGYPPTFRTKTPLDGKWAARYWDANLQRRPPPEEWRGLRCVLSVFLGSLRLLRNGGLAWGLVLTDVQVVEQAACPFGPPRAPSSRPEDGPPASAKQWLGKS